jgi:hypothetical protein
MKKEALAFTQTNEQAAIPAHLHKAAEQSAHPHLPSLLSPFLFFLLLHRQPPVATRNGDNNATVCCDRFGQSCARKG